MSHKPLVTVVTPCYNHENYIIESLESVKNQTYTNIQHIIIDDCSTDNSVKVIENWIKENDYDCTFIKHEVNQGICKTLNESIKLAKGKYWAGCTSDDAYLPYKIEKQIEKIEKSNEDVACVYTDSLKIDSSSNIIEGTFLKDIFKDIEIPTGNIFSRLIYKNFIPGMTVLIKMSVFEDLGMYDENLIYEDFDFYLRVAEKYKWEYIDIPTTKYRLHETNYHKTFTIDSLEDKFTIYYKYLNKGIPELGESLLDHIMLAYKLNSLDIKKHIPIYKSHYTLPKVLNFCFTFRLNYLWYLRFTTLLKTK